MAPASFGALIFLVSLSSFGRGGLWAFGFAAIIGYPIALVVGVPLYALLRARRLNGVATYSVASLCFSVLVASYFVGWPMLFEKRALSELLLPPTIGQIAIITFVCFMTVFVFWAIARPDKQP